jgi:hypothetical protein
MRQIKQIGKKDNYLFIIPLNRKNREKRFDFLQKAGQI